MFKPLRDKILELAITGKLVPQLESEPAVEQIGLAPAKEDEPFALPKKWKWVRLDQVTTKITDGTHNPPPNAGSGIPVLSAKDIDEAGVLDLNHVTRWATDYDFCKESKKIRIELNDVLLTIVGSIGRAAVVRAECKFMLQRSVAIIRPIADLSSDYLKSVFISPSVQQWFSLQAAGTAQKGIYLSKLKSMYIPLPPLEEQRRIVAKLDDIMGNLERMDQAYTELSGPMLKHFKNLVLQQAISGQLVPQLDSEPAVEQLGPAHKPEEVPFAIPEKWKWVALEDLFQFVDYRGKTPIKSASGVRLITSSNVRKGYLDHTRCEYISIDEYQSRQSRGVSHKGDILFTTEAPLGNVALADLDVFSVGQRVITLKSKGLALNECFVWFLLSNYFQTEILKQATGSTVQGIKAARLKKLVLPLPPIEEQKRIAARINKLFAEADKLLALKELSL